jgi:hypothetical protein
LSKDHPDHFNQKALYIGMAFLLVVAGIETCVILLLNSGHFTYTVDDSYIHLAMAENLRVGHYGINWGETSSPTSSILWPFLLATAIQTPFGEITPLLLNLISGLGVVWLFYKILVKSLLIEDHLEKVEITSILLILLIFATNLIGLIFTGMEHALQILFVTAILYGLILESENHKVRWWLVIAVVFAPLVRYENLAVSLAAFIYLCLRGQYKVSLGLIIATSLLVGGFSVFLTRSGLAPLPMSVLVKSPVVASGGNIFALFNNLKDNLNHRTGALLGIGLLCLSFFAVAPKNRLEERLLAISISVSIILHLLMGRYGMFNRYEIYIWSTCILLLLYLNRPHISATIQKMSALQFTTAGAVCTALICSPYLLSFFVTPLASNNIYEQQYQMQRFAIDFYRKPVAVNDIGFVAYQNERYVLDLWGLSSIEAIQLRNQGSDTAWMNQLAEKHSVHLAMIYDEWFGKLPTNWRKIAELHLGKMRISPAESVVSFYVLDDETYEQAYPLLEAFRDTLPEGVRLILKPQYP